MNDVNETIPYKQLVAAIITQAVEDYRALEEDKWIVAGGVPLNRQFNARLRRKIKSQNKRRRNGAKETGTYRVHGIVISRAEVLNLLHFFKRGGMMERWINFSTLAVSPDQIRRKIGVPA